MGSFLVIVGSFALGIYISRIFKMRVVELREFMRAMEFIDGEISYNHALLFEACGVAALRCKPPFDEWLRYLEQAMCAEYSRDSDIVSIWEEGLRLLREKTHIYRRDIELLTPFGQAFGLCDIKTQEGVLSLEIKRLQTELMRIEGELKEQMKLAIAFCIVVGLLIVILLL